VLGSKGERKYIKTIISKGSKVAMEDWGEGRWDGE